MDINLCKDSDVVLMCGVSGSGKTFYSLELEKCGYHRLSPDEIVWADYGPSVADIPFERQQQIFGDAFGKMMGEMRRLIISGEKVVVDSTMCKRHKRDMMREFCRELGVTPVLVYLDTPKPLLKERLSGRRGTGPDDQIVPEHLLERFCSNFEVPEADESAIVVTPA